MKAIIFKIKGKVESIEGGHEAGLLVAGAGVHGGHGPVWYRLF